MIERELDEVFVIVNCIAESVASASVVERRRCLNVNESTCGVRVDSSFNLDQVPQRCFEFAANRLFRNRKPLE